MAPASNEEQFKFLISCIRFSNSGKVDFGEVAKECNIVTKGAAAKRYERMMKSHGIAPNNSSARASPTSRAFKVEQKASIPAVKKRKVDDFLNELGAMADDDEIFDNIKSDPGFQKEQLQVKTEPEHAGDRIENSENDKFMSPLSGCSSQRYLCANSMFDQSNAGFDIRNNGDSIYDLAHNTSFLNFNNHEQPNDDCAQTNDRQVGGRKGDSIVITD